MGDEREGATAEVERRRQQRVEEWSERERAAARREDAEVRRAMGEAQWRGDDVP